MPPDEAMCPSSPSVVALFGATALGKSEVAGRLAERLHGEIVVADSMQVYRGLGIITNQPGEAELTRVRRHLVGYVAPQEEFTVARYARDAHETIDRLRAEGRAVVIEGGSGLYLRAALGDLEFAGGFDASLRRELERRWADDRDGVLLELQRRDPATAAVIDLLNPRRVIRALEAVILHGEALPAGTREALWRPPERYAHRLFALQPVTDAAVLTRRIERRVDDMLAAGALEEVARARAAGPLSRTARQAIGVQELCACLDGETSLAAAAARMKARTRALARRQATWMRKLPAVSLVPAGERDPEAVADEILGRIQ